MGGSSNLLSSHISREIRHALSGFARRGFGSVRVTVIVQGVAWKTSIFPDSKEGAYILPIKKDVRKQIGVDVGDNAEFRLIIDDIQ
ncbi:DUF1905 domain-containing protein [bacterium]|nr:DUF1905 domain-containing protein [bacterium]